MNYILFYSPKCAHCVQCLELLGPYAHFADSFLGYVNIHQSRQHLPSCVRRVPTLMSSTGDQMCEGTDVMRWIQEFILNVDTQQRAVQQQREQEQDVQARLQAQLVAEPVVEEVMPQPPPQPHHPEPQVVNMQNEEEPSFASVDVFDSASSLLCDQPLNWVCDLNADNNIETIDYTRVRSVEPTQTKSAMSLDSLMSQRNAELEKILNTNNKQRVFMKPPEAKIAIL